MIIKAKMMDMEDFMVMVTYMSMQISLLSMVPKIVVIERKEE